MSVGLIALIAIIGFVSFFLVFLYSACVVAKRADEQIELDWLKRNENKKELSN